MPKKTHKNYSQGTFYPTPLTRKAKAIPYDTIASQQQPFIAVLRTKTPKKQEGKQRNRFYPSEDKLDTRNSDRHLYRLAKGYIIVQRMFNTFVTLIIRTILQFPIDEPWRKKSENISGNFQRTRWRHDHTREIPQDCGYYRWYKISNAEWKWLKYWP